MIDLEHLTPDHSAARRSHERYHCNGINARLISSSNDYLKSLESAAHVATVTDISIDGLAITADQSLSIGELLSIEIITPGKKTCETVNAQVMWCKTSANDEYFAGLKVITKTKNVSDLQQNKKELVCSYCGEASFYLEDQIGDQLLITTHSCCRCGHSHYITDVIAGNRRS